MNQTNVASTHTKLIAWRRNKHESKDPSLYLKGDGHTEGTKNSARKSNTLHRPSLRQGRRQWQEHSTYTVSKRLIERSCGVYTWTGVRGQPIVECCLHSKANGNC